MAKAEDALIENLNSFVAFARKRVGDPELAADLVQDSLLKALKSADKPGDGEGAVTWFYRILRHSIIDLYRRRDVRDRALERLQAELPEQPDAAAAREICQCVKRLLPGLPEQYRDVLQRVDLDGAPPKEAASALGLTFNNPTSGCTVLGNVSTRKLKRRVMCVASTVVWTVRVAVSQATEATPVGRQGVARLGGTPLWESPARRAKVWRLTSFPSWRLRRFS